MARSPSICGLILINEGTVRPDYLTAAIELLEPRTEMVIVVAGTNAELVANTVYARGASLVTNSMPEATSFGSLRTGLQEVLSRGRDAALVVVADRPPAKAAVLEHMTAEFLDALESGQWAVVGETEGRRDYPMYADREMIEAILRSPANVTVDDVWNANAERIRSVSETMNDHAARFV